MKEVEVLSKEIDALLSKPVAKKRGKTIGTPLTNWHSTVHRWAGSANSPEVDPSQPLQIDRLEVDRTVMDALWGPRPGMIWSSTPTDPEIRRYYEEEFGLDFSDDESQAPDPTQLIDRANDRTDDKPCPPTIGFFRMPSPTTQIAPGPGNQLLTQSEIDALLAAVEGQPDRLRIPKLGDPVLSMMEEDLVRNLSKILDNPWDADDLPEKINQAHTAYAAEHNNQLPPLIWDSYANEIGQRLAETGDFKSAAHCFEIALRANEDTSLNRDVETMANYAINFVNAVGDYPDQSPDKYRLINRENMLRQAVQHISSAMRVNKGVYVHIDRAMDMLDEIKQLKKSLNPDTSKEDEFLAQSKSLQEEVLNILRSDSLLVTAAVEADIDEAIKEYGKTHNFELPKTDWDFASELGKILQDRDLNREAGAFFEYAMGANIPEAEKIDYAADFIRTTSDYLFHSGIMIDRQRETDWLVAKEQKLAEAIRIVRQNQGPIRLGMSPDQYEKHTRYTTVLSRGMAMLERLRGPVA